MAGVYKYILVRRTASYNSVVSLQSIKSRYSWCETHTRYPTKVFEKKNVRTYKEKEGKDAGISPLDFPFSEGVHSTFESLALSQGISQIDIYLYVRIDTWEILTRKREHSTPRRGTTRARAGSPPADSGEMSMVRHVEQTPHRMVDLISS